MDFSFRILLENQGNAIDTVYLDVSKVFDVVSHDIFKNKDKLTFKYLYVQALGRMVKVYRMLVLKSATPVVGYHKILFLALS